MLCVASCGATEVPTLTNTGTDNIDSKGSEKGYDKGDGKGNSEGSGKGSEGKGTGCEGKGSDGKGYDKVNDKSGPAPSLDADIEAAAAAAADGMKAAVASLNPRDLAEALALAEHGTA